MTTIERHEYGYEIKSSTYTINIPLNDMSLLMNRYMKDSLRSSIEYELKQADGDTIDISKYPYSYEELIDEVFVDLEDEIDYGNPPTDEDIKNKIEEVASFYEMEL